MSRPLSVSRMVASKTLAAVLALSLVAPSVLEARFQPRPAGGNMFSREQEVQVGREAAADADKKLPILSPSDPISRYISNLGQQLAAHAPAPAYPYTFKVVNQKDINAFALPGGPIYVNLGTIQAADNEAQIAGVMAHEISHVVMRHATSNASKQMVAQFPLAILGGILGNGIGGQLAQLGLQLGVGSYFLKNSRTAETQADLLGSDILYDTGYNPQAMPDFFRKLEQQGGGSNGPQFMSDHPNPGNRAATVSKEIATLPARSNYRSDSAEFQNIKRRAMGMRALTAQEIAQQQRSGAINNGGGNNGTIDNGQGGGIAPTGNFRSLDHGAFRISYPDNWQVFGDQQSAVTIAPQAGLSDNAIAYGVMINGFQPESARTLDEATRELLNSLHQSNPDLRLMGNSENIRVNGVTGKSVQMFGPSPIQTQRGAVRERDWLVVMPRRDGTILYLIFISPDQNFQQLAPTFENMLRSLRLK